MIVDQVEKKLNMKKKNEKITDHGTYQFFFPYVDVMWCDEI